MCHCQKKEENERVVRDGGRERVSEREEGEGRRRETETETDRQTDREKGAFMRIYINCTNYQLKLSNG